MTEFLRSTCADIRGRLNELGPAVDEHALPTAALNALEHPPQATRAPRKTRAASASAARSESSDEALSVIRLHPGLRAEQLAARAQLTTQTVQRVLTNLQANGTIELLSGGGYTTRPNP